MNYQNHDIVGQEIHSITFFSSRYKVNKFIFTVLYFFYLALSLFRFTRPGFLITCIIVGLGLLALILLGARIKKKYIPSYVFAGLLVISFLFSSLFVSRTEGLPRIFLHIVSCTGIAMLLLRGYVYSWGGYIVFYSLAFYFLILMLTGVNSETVLTFTSWNGISMLMLVACISLYIILGKENKDLSLLPALLTLIISIWGVGRSGIVSSFVLLLGLIFIKIRSKPKYIYNLIIYFIVAFIFSDVIIRFGMDYVNVDNAVNLYLARETEPSVRLEIWSNYLNNLDIFRLIFGANVFTDPWPEKGVLAYNYHNSFINLHLQTGFMGLITMGLIVFSLFKYFKMNLVYFFLFITVMLRWFTDYGIFFDSFDFIPYFFIFYYLQGISFSNISFPIFSIFGLQKFSSG